MPSKQILAIVVAVLALTLLIIPVYAASRSPPYSNQSLYPNFNNQCKLPSFDSGAGNVNGQRCMSIDRSSGKANQKSQVWVVTNCISTSCVARAETSAGFNDNPVPGNSPIVRSVGGGHHGVQYRSYIDSHVRMDTSIGGASAAKYEVIVTLWKNSGSGWLPVDSAKWKSERANGDSGTSGLKGYVGRFYNDPSVADYTATVKVTTYARINVSQGQTANANVDAYNTGYWTKVNNIEVCLIRC
ncbi:MAG: hypothetical protein QXS25_01640 [Candidatus Nitrosocaldus sp.]